MENYKDLTILLSFVSLWLTSFMDSTTENILGISLILSVGMLHGTNDLKILSRLNLLQRYSFLKKHFLIYNVIIVLGGLFFYFFPQITFLLFFIISGYHFGEQHFNYLILDHFVKYIFYLVYGFLIFLILFYNHQTEVIVIVKDLLDFRLQDAWFEIFLIANSILFIILLTYLYHIKHMSIKQIIKELFYLLVLLLIFKVSSLVWGFTVYFIFWHSVPSINEQITFFYNKINIKNWIRYLKDGAFIWTLSLIFFLLFVYIFKDDKLFETLIFGFLTMISFPHIFTMICLLKK